MSARISLRELADLVDTLRRCHHVGFLAVRLNYHGVSLWTTGSIGKLILTPGHHLNSIRGTISTRKGKILLYFNGFCIILPGVESGSPRFQARRSNHFASKVIGGKM